MDSVVTIIVHYNNAKDTRECVDSLLLTQEDSCKNDIIVVDNGSLETFALTKKQREAGVTLIRSEANIGFTGGNNLGISHAREHFDPDFFLLLNNDTTVEPNFLQELCELAKNAEKPGLITPKIYFQKGNEFHKEQYKKSQLGKIFWYAGGSIDWRNLLAFHRGVDEFDYGQFDSQESYEFASACCVLIPRQVIETVGLLDKNFFLYFEDTDYSMRVKKAGFDLLFAPKSVIYHKNAGASGGAGAPTSVYYQSRNRLLFFMRHGNWRQRATALQLLLRYLSTGNKYERKAVIDFIFGRFGKQALV